MPVKKWHFAGITSDTLAISFMILDLDYVAGATLTVVDLEQGKTLFDQSWLGAPKLMVRIADEPGAGADAVFQAPGIEMTFKRAALSSDYVLSVRSKDIELFAALDSSRSPEPLRVEGQGVAVRTQKTVLLGVKGDLKIGDERRVLDGAWGGLDYTAGKLPRHTVWNWAFATGRSEDGTAVALNLSNGNNLGGASENAAWVGAKRSPLAEVDFNLDRGDLMKPWRIKSRDGELDLSFQPVGAHSERRNLVVVKSRFEQIAGHFTGKLLGQSVRKLPGFVEDQDTKW